MTEAGKNLKLVTLVAGVIVSFTVFGWAQEKVTQSTFGPEKERFRDVPFLVFVQSLGNALAGAVVLLWRYGRKVKFSGGVPSRDWLIVATFCLGAHQFGYTSLQHITFPMQVVCKSCKSIPVMFGETLVAGKTHTLAKKLSVVLMSVGVVVFTLMGPKKGGGEEIPSSRLLFGLFLVLMALICDGIYGPYQNRITAKHEVCAGHLMFNLNIWETVLSLALCLTTGSFMSGVNFVARHPDILPLLAVFAAAMSVGAFFIANLQHSFGALVVTITTTMRKLISVLLSVALFGHHLSAMQWAAVGTVFLASELGRMIARVVEGPPAKDPEKKAL